MAYGHASGRDTAELFDSIRQHLEMGYRSIRVQTVGARASTPCTASPRSRARAASATTTSRPSAAPLPAEEDWDTRAYLRHLPAVFEAVRNEFGPELPLLHDGHHRMTPIQAAKLGKALEPYDLFWLEDCTPAENQEALRLVRAAHHHAAGHRRGLQHRLGLPDADQRAADRLRALRGHPHRRHHARMRKLLDFAAQYQIKSGIHGPTDISPVGHGRGAAPRPGHPQLRHPGVHAARRADQRGVPAVLHLRATATCTPASSPGSGVELDEDAAARFPYQPAYLPFNRLKDGTVHDW